MTPRAKATRPNGSLGPGRLGFGFVKLEDKDIPVRIVPSVRAERRQARRGRAFIRGPIPFRVVEAIRKAEKGGSAWVVALALRYKADVTRQAWIKPPATLLERWGVDKDARARALAALERAGLVEVQRRKGRPPLVHVLPWEIGSDD